MSLSDRDSSSTPSDRFSAAASSSGSAPTRAPSLHDKVALVTGGSRGIGAATARALAARGAHVAIVYRQDEAAARRVVDAITGIGGGIGGGSARAFRADVTDAAAVARVVTEVAAAFGRIDIVVNNAGTYDERAFGDNDAAFVREQFDTHVLSTILVTQQAVAHFPSSGGRVINVSSNLAFAPDPGNAVYSAAKGAVVTLTRAFARDLGKRGITVNAVAPAVTRTDMTAAIPDEVRAQLAAATPLGRLAEPDDIADVIAFLASDDARWITGRTLLTDGGIT